MANTREELSPSGVQVRCGWNCAHCALATRGAPPGDPAAPRGGSAVLGAVGCFLVPTALACAGAALGTDELSQFIGAAVGLGTGAAVSAAVSAWIGRRRGAREEVACQQH